MLGYGLIMTCHLKENYDEEGHLISAKPDLNNRCLKIVNGLVDIIAVITQEWDKDGNSIRWVQTRSTPHITAGTRYKYMDPKIPFGYNEFVKALAEAIDKEAENGATVVDTNTRIIQEELDFDKVYTEAKDLWTKLVIEPQDEEMANKINKKIEIAFGHPMKLSEVTEDQVDILNLVVLEMKDLLK